ncbi:MAG: hypothetical protein QXL66_03380 [Thermoplasmata archaeon]
MTNIISGNIGLEQSIAKKLKFKSIDVTVNWSWYDENNGIVSWNFKNNSTEQKSVVLYRSGYYFGNAFFPIYVNNGMTSWATAPLTPLVDNGVANNTMPIGIIDFGGGKRIIAFIFTFAPGQSWSVLEGGFSSALPPTNPMVFDVSLEKAGSFCIGYDPEQVIAWDTQTGTSMTGYSPNPNTFTTVEMSIPSDAQYISLFNDPINDGQCPQSPNCLQMLENSIAQGNIEEFIEAIICYLNQFGISSIDFITKFIDIHAKKLVEDKIKKLENEIETIIKHL